VTLKKDPVQLSFALAGVRTPLRAQQASAGRPATQDEPHCHEALALTRRLVLQRDVELDVRRLPPACPNAPGGGLEGPAWGALSATRSSARSGITALRRRQHSCRTPAAASAWLSCAFAHVTRRIWHPCRPFPALSLAGTRVGLG